MDFQDACEIGDLEIIKDLMQHHTEWRLAC